MSSNPTREWLTVAWVAESEGTSARTILRWIQAGKLRARRQPGGRLRIHRDWYADMVGVTGTNDDDGGE